MRCYLRRVNSEAEDKSIGEKAQIVRSVITKREAIVVTLEVLFRGIG